ncbi:hypothetical protein H0H92_002767 [Tricholoma furcatifolium]|nr:hypothetical protein H0H92_002767 [Tricholoma furcatifolium]
MGGLTKKGFTSFRGSDDKPGKSLKDLGNKAFAAKEYDKSIDLFTRAIAIDPTNYVLFSNRSAAKTGKKDYDGALADAEETVRMNPSWGKGWARKGAALHGARRYDEAIAAFQRGLAVEDSLVLRKGLQEVQDAKDPRAIASDGANGNPFGKIFAGPNLLAKLATNPKTSKHLADPFFVQKLQAYQRNPQLATTTSALEDPRMMDVLGIYNKSSRCTVL